MSNKEISRELVDRSSIVFDFLNSIETGKIKIISSSVVFEPRLQEHR